MMEQMQHPFIAQKTFSDRNSVSAR